MKVYITVLAFLLGFAAQAQRPRFKKQFKYTSIGFNVNAMNYQGDLDPHPSIISPGLKFTKLNFGVCMLQRITPRISVRGNFSRGTIEASDYENSSYSGDNIYRKIRNLSFINTIYELKADVIYDLRPFTGIFPKRLDYVPYIFGGLAYFHHNPKAQAPASFGGKWVALQPLELEGQKYSLNQIAIPVGIGFRFKLSEQFDLAYEVGFRFTFTDYLDDVSGKYVGREHFANNPLAAAMQDRSMEAVQKDPILAQWVESHNGYNTSGGYTTINGYGRAGDQRGDPSRKDMYIVSGFHLIYIFKPQVVCPVH